MKRLILFFLSFVLLTTTEWACKLPSDKETGSSSKRLVEDPAIPMEAYAILWYVRQHHQAQPGYVGGKRFGNYEKLLPEKDQKRKKIFYKEWDIYPRQEGVNRGPHRIVTGSDQRAWYTPDHYQSFIELFPTNTDTSKN